jgi:hypothetical protein
MRNYWILSTVCRRFFAIRLSSTPTISSCCLGVILERRAPDATPFASSIQSGRRLLREVLLFKPSISSDDLHRMPSVPIRTQIVGVSREWREDRAV